MGTGTGLDPQIGDTVYLASASSYAYEVIFRFGEIIRIRRSGSPRDPVLTRHINHLDQTRGTR